jgi:phage-related protein
MALAERRCVFVGSSRSDLSEMPDVVKVRFGHGLHLVQQGREPSSAKALKGFGGRGVLELIEDHDGNTYRAVYTVRFAEAVYVLHAFQKKSKSGIATPKHVMNLVASRLKDAEAMHRAAMKTGAAET